MKLELEKPFSDMYIRGYTRVGKDGRCRVDLVKSKTERTTMSYARYRVCVNLGYILSDEFEVDHIDNNKSNDCFSNLQILSVQDHRTKSITEGPKRKYVFLTCPVCLKEFKRFTNLRVVKNPKCSRRCNGIASKRIQMSL